jgi:hypothetical protein
VERGRGAKPQGLTSEIAVASRTRMADPGIAVNCRVCGTPVVYQHTEDGYQKMNVSEPVPQRAGTARSS